jgi:hypothetical protein
VLHIRSAAWSAFQVCGLTGLAFAILLALALVLHQGLSPWVMLGLVGVAVAAFFALSFVTKIILGYEQLVYYHHEIAVMASCASALWLFRQPALPYLDATLLGIGLFLAFGRIGCLMVGCCHGRPHAWGVSYREEHARAGFSPALVGVRLFPIQAIESLWVFAVVLVGSLLVWSGKPAGTALAWYVVMYDLGRFCFEFARGDTGRPYYGGFSEAQWISLGLTALVVGAEVAGWLPFQAWHLVALIGMAGAMEMAAINRRTGPVRSQLLDPAHIQEIAETLAHSAARAASGSAAAASGEPAAVHVGCTSLGLRLSAGRIGEGVAHVTFSMQDRALPEDAARAIADLILHLRLSNSPGRLARSNRGVFHLLLGLSLRKEPEL